MKRYIFAVLVLGLGTTMAAEDPVHWTLAFDTSSAPPGGHAIAKLTAKLDAGWHLYSLSTPAGGPNPTRIKLPENPSIAGFKVYQPKFERKLDQGFQIDTETFGSDTTFLLDIDLNKSAAAGPIEVSASARYQVCTDKKCLPPKTKTATATITVDTAAKSQTLEIPAGYTEFKPAAAATSSSSSTGPPSAPPPAAPATQDSFAWFLLTAFGFGLAAIFTPCVFPMIPITVSYFLNRQGDKVEPRSDSLRQAIVFCLGIIVLFTGLGFLVTVIAGPIGVKQLGSSPWVNGFIVVVFVVFGLSLLGAFELTLPSGLLTKMDAASRRSGYTGTLLMGLTFSLTSFACIGPLVGSLLVASIQGHGLQPVFGMIAFATGLATPFFLLALFPSYLQRLPKRGMWMARVKVVLGFVILAASVKYLSVIDERLQLDILTRERFLAAWIVLSLLAGLYLLGFLRLEGISATDHLSVGRMLLGAVFLIFSVSLIPGMWGVPLGELDAFVPPPTSGSTIGGGELVWMKDQYREALARAKAENKLVLVDFTGYACTNCKWMKTNMFPRPEIASQMKNFVPLELYTDGSDATSQFNQQLEEKMFSTVAIPFYAILDPHEKVVAKFESATRNSQEFLSFLKSGANSNTPTAGL